jgi:DNA-binding transcriptional ArsR family regulator
MDIKLEDIIRTHILDILDLCDYSRVDASLMLGMSNRTLRFHLKKYKDMGIHIPDRSSRVDHSYIECKPDIQAVKKKDKPKDISYTFDGFPTNEQRLYYLNTKRNPTNLSRDMILDNLALECHSEKLEVDQSEYHCNP